jgi:hypothetical protein
MAPQVREAAVAEWSHWLPCWQVVRPACARAPPCGARCAVLRPGVLGQAVRRGDRLLRVVPRLRRAARGVRRAPLAQHLYPAGGASMCALGMLGARALCSSARALCRSARALRCAGSGCACCTPAGSALLAVVASRAGDALSAQLGAHAGARRWEWARPRCSWTWCWTATTASPTWTTRRWP